MEANHKYVVIWSGSCPQRSLRHRDAWLLYPFSLYPITPVRLAMPFHFPTSSSHQPSLRSNIPDTDTHALYATTPLFRFSISSFNCTKSCSVASNSNPCLTHCSASSNRPISRRHFPRLHQPFAFPTFFISTLASASTAPSAQFCCAIFACARLLSNPDTSSRTKPDGSHDGRPSAISIARPYSLTAWL